MKTNLLRLIIVGAFLGTQGTAQVTYSTVALQGSTNPGIPVPNLNRNLFSAINSKGNALVLGISSGSVFNGRVDGLWAGAPGSAQLLALDGTPAPGAEPDALFLIFEDGSLETQATDYAINSAGQVVLRALLRGSATADNDLGLWVGVPGALQLVARKGSPAPETEPGTVFSDISPGTARILPGPVINAAGQVAFAASLSGPSINPANGTGIWMGTPGSLRLVVRGQGMVVNPLINDAGQVAYWTGAGIWTGPPGATQLLVRLGAPAPGLQGITNQFVNGQLTFNNAGQVAFYANLGGPGVVATNNRALWLADNNGLNLIARTGTQAPGVSPGIVFSDFPGLISFAAGPIPVLNGAGEVAFVARLAGPGATATNNLGIWITAPNGPRLVARTGDLAPGIADGVRFQGMGAQPALTDKGDIAFQALLNGPGVAPTNNTAIYVGKAGALRVAARTGTQIDAGNGVMGFLTNIRHVSTGLGSSQGGHSPGLGEDGQVLFSASLFNSATLRDRNAVLIATPAHEAGGQRPRILSMVKTGDNVQIRFTTEAGRRYGLETRENLNTTPWAALPGDVVAGSTEATLTDTADSKGATLFYRIRVIWPPTSKQFANP